MKFSLLACWFVCFLHLHLGNVGEISRADVMLSLQDAVNLGQTHDQLLLLLLTSKQRRHLLLQIADDVSVHLETNVTHRRN